MFGLRILRLIYPPFHPVKYKYIDWWFGKQTGHWNKYTDI